MGNDKTTLLYAACFLVIAVVIVTLPDLERPAPTAPPLRGFGPEALPFACDFTREASDPDDQTRRFMLRFDSTADGPFAYCATLIRGTGARPAPGGGVICFAHVTDDPQDLWQDAVGGSLRISGDDGATYLRRERPPGADAFAATTDIAYGGLCTRGA